jgi:type I restriction enzyme, R subunit
LQGALQSLKDEVPILRDRHARVLELFRSRGIEGLEDTEVCVAALADERVRAEFTVKLKLFLDTLDLVLPRPEALPFTRDAKTLSYIYARARNRYKDTPVLGKDVGAKVRKLIDDHVISLGIDPKIPPISLTDADFETHVARQPNDRAKASEMEHAIRYHIRKHLDEDPVLFRKLSERLKDILDKLGERWGELVTALQHVLDDLRQDKPLAGEELPELPAHYRPFLRMVLDTVAGTARPDQELMRRCVDLTAEVVDLITGELTPTFWRPNKKPDQDALNARIFEQLMASRLVDAANVEALTDNLLSLARSNHERLLKL